MNFKADVKTGRNERVLGGHNLIEGEKVRCYSKPEKYLGPGVVK